MTFFWGVCTLVIFLSEFVLQRRVSPDPCLHCLGHAWSVRAIRVRLCYQRVRVFKLCVSVRPVLGRVLQVLLGDTVQQKCSSVGAQSMYHRSSRLPTQPLSCTLLYSKLV